MKVLKSTNGEYLKKSLWLNLLKSIIFNLLKEKIKYNAT